MEHINFEQLKREYPTIAQTVEDLAKERGISIQQAYEKIMQSVHNASPLGRTKNMVYRNGLQR